MLTNKTISKFLQLARYAGYSSAIAAIVLTSVLLLARTSTADSDSFLPTWKLLNHQEKQHFVSGYIYGWKDAYNVTDIAIQYIKENPKTAVESLEKLKMLYNMEHVKPDQLVGALDNFYSDPDNSAATLSMAVSAARKNWVCSIIYATYYTWMDPLALTWTPAVRRRHPR